MGVLLWAACGLYVCVAIAWLWLRGITGAFGSLEKVMAVGLVLALGAFLVLMFTVDRPDDGPHLPWWRLFRRW